MRATSIEGRYWSGEPLNVKRESDGAFWVDWDALSMREFRYWTNSFAPARVCPVLRNPRIAEREAWVEINDLRAKAIGMIHLRQVIEEPKGRAGAIFPLGSSPLPRELELPL